jgi:hypothetical protein
MKTCLTLIWLAISLALPTFAQEQSAVDPETRQEIEAVAMQFVEAYSKHDAAATQHYTLRTPFAYWTGEAVLTFSVRKPSRKASQRISQRHSHQSSANFFKCMHSKTGK